MKANYSQKRWFSLRFAIYHFWRLRKKFGEIATIGNKFQKEREAWIVATALLGISKITGRIWWVQIPENDPPDILAMTLTANRRRNLNFINYRLVEVMEITKYSRGNIANEIINKTKNKLYQKETCLIVYLRRDKKIKDIRKIANNLKRKVDNLTDIWVIGNTKKDTNNFILFSLFPEVQVADYDLDEEIKKIPPGDTIELIRARGTDLTLVRGVFLAKFNPQK